MLPERIFENIDAYIDRYGHDKVMEFGQQFLVDQAVFGEPEVDLSYEQLNLKSEEDFLNRHDERYRAFIKGHEERILEQVIRPVRKVVDTFINEIQDLFLGYDEIPQEVLKEAFRRGFHMNCRNDIDLLNHYPEGCCTMIRDYVDEVLNSMMSDESVYSNIQADPAFERLKEFSSGGGRLDRIYGIVNGDKGDPSFHGAFRIGMREYGLLDVAGDSFLDSREPVAWYQPDEYMDSIKTFERFSEVCKTHGDFGREVFAFNPGFILGGAQIPFSFYFPLLSRQNVSGSLLNVDVHSMGLLARNLMKKGALAESFFKSQGILPLEEEEIVRKAFPHLQRIMDEDFDRAHQDLSTFPPNFQQLISDSGGIEVYKKRQTSLRCAKFEGEEVITQSFRTMNNSVECFAFIQGHLGLVNSALRKAQQ